jgi:hypothetical protein
MSGGSSQQTAQLDPALRDAYLANVTRAQGVASGLAPRQFAGFTTDQQRSFDVARHFADPNTPQNWAGLDAASSLATSAGNYDPLQVTSRDVTASLANAAQLGRGTVRDVNAERIAAERIAAAQAQRTGARDVGIDGVTGAQVTSEALGQIAPQARANIRDVNAASFLNQNIQQYMNPYTQAVTEQGLTELERARQLQQQQTAAQATAARAFGGSRQGVAEAETNRAFGETAQKYIAQQNAQAYDAAQRASEADLARAMQAQQLNQAQDLATTQQSLQLAGQFGLANQDAALRAALANQGVDVQYGLSNAQLQQQAALANQATGLSASQANQDAMLRSALANQGYDFNVGQLNTQNQQQVNLANQAAQNQIAQQNAANFLQANLANQGAGLQANQQRLAAAGQVANIAGQGQQMGLTGAQALQQQGALQQGFSQQQLDAIRNLPLEQQQIINQALGLNVGGGSGTQTSSTSRQGLLGVLGL